MYKIYDFLRGRFWNTQLNASILIVKLLRLFITICFTKDERRLFQWIKWLWCTTLWPTTPTWVLLYLFSNSNHLISLIPPPPPPPEPPQILDIYIYLSLRVWLLTLIIQFASYPLYFGFENCKHICLFMWPWSKGLLPEMLDVNWITHVISNIWHQIWDQQILSRTNRFKLIIWINWTANFLFGQDCFLFTFHLTLKLT